jgi:rhamnogalacturonan endolyase
VLWNAKLGHGDALHVSDLDSGRPGLEIFAIHEHAGHGKGADFRDAASGKVLWSKPAFDVPRGCALDIDPRHAGHECWASNFPELFDCRGKSIGRKPRTCNMGIWWDGDLLRELLSGTRITKWNWESQIEESLLRADDFGCAANNGSKANPCVCADLWGDWREEIIYRTLDGKSLRIFTSAHPTTIRRPCLMQDSIYRLGIAWQNVGYNQPAHLSGPVERTAIENSGK